MQTDTAPALSPPPDPDKLDILLGRMVGDLGAIATGALVVLGDRLGLYRAMKSGEKLSPGELARRTGTRERYVREWLSGQAAAGYVNYDEGSNLFWLTPEQVAVFADEASPACDGRRLRGRVEPLARRAQGGGGVPLRRGRRPGTTTASASSAGPSGSSGPATTPTSSRAGCPRSTAWSRSSRRARASPTSAAGTAPRPSSWPRPFPQARFTGFDYHAPSIERAREAAEEAGVSGNTRFEVAPAKDFTGTYDLVAFFDCLHDMGDPVGAAAHVRESARPGRHLDDRRALRQRPARRQPQPGRAHLLRRLDDDLHAGVAGAGGRPRARRAGRRDAPPAGRDGGGFTSFRRAAETPFNIVFEARP